MHQLWQHRNGIWYVLHGPRLRKRVSTRTQDRTAAEMFLTNFIAASGGLADDIPLVGALLDAYCADRLPNVRGKDALQFSVKVLKRHFANLLPHNLTPLALRKFVKDRGASAGTILREVGVLRAALAWAVEHRRIPAKPIISNPVATPPPRDRWITKDEARRLLASCVEPHVKTF